MNATELHVAPTGNNSNSGSKESPLRTIQRAAELALPGDTITVHEGVYRERIDPPRGGLSDANRIVYQAAPGENVEIKGSEPVRGWVRENGDVWKVVLANSFFGAFNPFADLIQGDWFRSNKRNHHTGAVYLDGEWFAEAPGIAEVLKPAGKTPLWFARVNTDTTTIWAQFKDTDPNARNVEINVRRTLFYPSLTGINFLTVRGFRMSQAATPWAPPTAEQVGLIGTNWSKGWIIENNTISHSVCSGISLGKYGDAWDNQSADTAEGYVKTIERASANGWNRDTVGSHIVRDNHISHCEQAGIVGSLGCSFSTITGNTIHDIHVRRLFSGDEMAGIKFHGAVDMLIERNHIYRTNRGLWLDWMAQGTRVTRNLFHDNDAQQDIFLEVNHGPVLVDNNLFLSPNTLLSNSQGITLAHNLCAGTFKMIRGEKRMTPVLKAHSTDVIGLRENPAGDQQVHNNIFVGGADLGGFDDPVLPVHASGNLFFKGTKAGNLGKEARLFPDDDPAVALEEKSGEYLLRMRWNPAQGAAAACKMVTSETLGKAVIPDLPYLNPDQSKVRIDTDYFGKARTANPSAPGPFEGLKAGETELKVWPPAAR